MQVPLTMPQAAPGSTPALRAQSAPEPVDSVTLGGRAEVGLLARARALFGAGRSQTVVELPPAAAAPAPSGALGGWTTTALLPAAAAPVFSPPASRTTLRQEVEQLVSAAFKQGPLQIAESVSHVVVGGVRLKRRRA